MGSCSRESYVALGRADELDLLLKPIPLESVEGWESIPAKDNRDFFRPVGPGSQCTDYDTAVRNFSGIVPECTENILGTPEKDKRVQYLTHYVREGVLRRLGIARRQLFKGDYFRFLDESLHNPFWIDKGLEGGDLQQRTSELQGLNLDTYRKLRETGAVVDTTIVHIPPTGQHLLNHLKDPKGFPSDPLMLEYYKKKAAIIAHNTMGLNMGTLYDHSGNETYTRYFEELNEKSVLDEEGRTILRNRRYLYRIMTMAGFVNNPLKWWEWHYGDGMWAVHQHMDHSLYRPYDKSSPSIYFS